MHNRLDGMAIGMGYKMKRVSVLQWIEFTLPPAVLGVWGSALLHVSQSGALAGLQHPRYALLTQGAAILLLLFAMGYPFLFEPPSNPLDARGPWLFIQCTILSLPAALLLVVPMEGHSAAFLSSRIQNASAIPSVAGTMKDKPPWLDPAADGTPAEVDILRLQMVAWDKEYAPLLEGLRVKTTGQWIPSSSGEPKFFLMRLMMFCCAADAMPLVLEVRGANPSLAEGAWLEAEGILHLRKEGAVLELEPERIEEMEPPAYPYLF